MSPAAQQLLTALFELPVQDRQAVLAAAAGPLPADVAELDRRVEAALSGAIPSYSAAESAAKAKAALAQFRAAQDKR